MISTQRYDRQGRSCRYSLQADGLEQDDVKLLRLRTKKHELVIVPDAKYIFIVVHDTPPA